MSLRFGMILSQSSKQQLGSMYFTTKQPENLNSTPTSNRYGRLYWKCHKILSFLVITTNSYNKKKEERKKFRHSPCSTSKTYRTLFQLMTYGLMNKNIPKPGQFVSFVVFHTGSPKTLQCMENIVRTWPDHLIRFSWMYVEWYMEVHITTSHYNSTSFYCVA